MRVRSFDEGEFVVVEVEDNGPGIPAEVMPRIFDSFFTTKAARHRHGPGAVHLARGSCAARAGRSRVDSRPGEGATFRVRLPARRPVAPTVTPPSEVTPPPREYPSAACWPSTTRRCC